MSINKYSSTALQVSENLKVPFLLSFSARSFVAVSRSSLIDVQGRQDLFSAERFHVPGLIELCFIPFFSFIRVFVFSTLFIPELYALAGKLLSSSWMLVFPRAGGRRHTRYMHASLYRTRGAPDYSFDELFLANASQPWDTTHAVSLSMAGQ